MTAVTTLFSGSSGNCTHVGSEHGGFLIDAGKNLKTVTQSLDAVGLSLTRVRAVFVTHTHSDHIAALKVLTAHHPDILVFGSAKTLEFLEDGAHVSPAARLIEIDERGTEVLGHRVAAFSTPHDAEGSCGYLITTPGGRRIGVCTDLGHVTQSVTDALSGCCAAVLESNHDVDVLKAGPYPYPLKQRILGPNGHLCNNDCAALAATLLQRGCRDFALAHLSEHNNHPQLAYETTLRRLLDCGGEEFNLSVASPTCPSRHFEVQ